MNNNLLLRKRINFPKQYIEFLHFIHPQFEIVEDIDSYDNCISNGIIYIGNYSNDLIDKLNRFTDNWIIVNAHHFDEDLTTNDGLVKNLLPLHYIKAKNSNKECFSIYNNISYDLLLEKVKNCLISNTQLILDDSSDMSVYSLFSSILGTQDILNSEFFNLVNKDNISLVTSSVLTFLNKVQTQNIRGSSAHYANLIIQSNRRYGKRIKQAISKFIKSKSNKEVSLYNLLTDLNKVK